MILNRKKSPNTEEEYLYMYFFGAQSFFFLLFVEWLSLTNALKRGVGTIRRSRLLAQTLPNERQGKAAEAAAAAAEVTARRCVIIRKKKRN